MVKEIKTTVVSGRIGVDFLGKIKKKPRVKNIFFLTFLFYKGLLLNRYAHLSKLESYT